MNKFARITFKLLDVLIIFVLAFGSPMSALAHVWTDPADYPPGSTVTIRGDNSDEDNDHNFAALEQVIVSVAGPNGYTSSCEAYADESGAWQCDITLWDTELAVGEYNYTAVGQTSGNAESGVFTDAASGNLDQCANDPFPSPSTDGCATAATEWENGNLNQAKSVYFEGDSIPYRLRFGDLSLGSHTVTIEWDTTKSDKHALDYITSFDRTVATANPCLGVSGCTFPGVLNTDYTEFAIPADPQVTGASVAQEPGNFTLYGGTITAVSAYSYPNGAGFTGDKSARITITFTANVANPVLAWGGHIATRSDWGAGNSAVAIPGSPYHTRFIELDGKGGNQDRSLSAAAVIFPGSITIIKDAIPDDAQDFSFTSTGGLGDFLLDDDADGTLANTQVFSGIVSFTTYTFTEGAASGWTLSFGNSVCTVTSANGGSQSANAGTRTVTINLQEGENVTCTFINTRQAATLTLIKTVNNDNGGTAVADDFQAYIDGNEVPWNSAQSVSPGAHTASESTLAGYTASSWGGDCAADGSVSLSPGQNKTCTITNSDDPPSLTLVKVVVNDNGGTAVESDWTLTAAGPTGFSGPGPSVSNGDSFDAGTYDLSESGPSGYTASNWVCVGGTQDDSDTVTVGLGQSVTCTITNDDNNTSLTLIKQVVNDNGGTALASAWTLYAGANSVTGSESGAVATTLAGTYALSESSVAGYSNTSVSCDNGDGPLSVTVDLGENVTCTFVNDDLAPTLTLVKVVVNDNGGTAVESDWTLTASGPTGFSGAGPSVSNGTSFDAGTYNLSESGPAGYTASDWVCVGGTQDDADTITVGLGESATCTITNDDNNASLTLVKVVVNDNGGSAVESDWTLTASGPTGFSGPGPSVSNGSSFDAGTYNLSESGPAGYTASDWVCAGGTQNDSDTITVGLGESATCTITNDDNAPSLTLIKVVVNDNGGSAVESDWTLTASGPTGFSGPGPSVSNGTSFDAGTYDLLETGPAGYSSSAWVCAGGTQDDSDTITLGLGESATCTITNDDNAASLTLVKVVVNDNGGTAVESDWTLTATGPTGFSGAGPNVSNGPSFDAGTYDLAESGPAGYTASNWVCTGGTQNDSDTITVGLGESATCTITNDDNAPALTLVKVVVNNNGGTAVESDWMLTASGPTGFSGAGPSVSNGTSFDAGTYNLSETGPSGYTASNWVCVGGTQDDSDTITVGLGESATCTITNDDNAPSLTLVKVVVNDNGGSAVESDWTLSASGPTGFSGVGPSVSNGSSFDAGTYDLSETGPSGYTASDWVCVGGTQDDADTVTLGLGESATCTITNNDNAPSLTLVKVVINDNGGTAVESDWTLTATGPTGFSGAGPSVSNGSSFDAGTYDLSESGPSGYTASDWVCDGGTQDDTNSITVALGESATCTITNDDNAPSLTLVKVVVNDNGGTAVESDWTLTASGPTGFSGLGPSVSNGSSFDAGTYDLSESGPSGYTASNWVCVGGTQDDADTITVGLGESATCTITNDDNAPSLTLIKVVVNNNGGTASASNWTLTASGPTGFSGAGPSVSNGSSFDVGTYDLAESGPVGYTASDWVCVGGTQDDVDTITLGLGESATCTITNNDIPPSLTLNKIVINDNGGTAAESAWTLTANGGLAGILSGAGAAGNADVVSGPGFKAGTYTLSESAGPYGYTAGSWSCVKNGGSAVTGNSITLGLGDTATCTIINNDKPGTIIVEKIIKPVGALTSFSFQTTGDGGANALPDYQNFSLSGGNLNSQTLDAGSYTVKELVPLGWALTGIGGGLPVSADASNTKYYCTVTGSGGSSGIGDLLTQTATIDLKNGDTVKCVFENTGQGATRTQGFWATHLALAKIAWEGGSGFGHTFPGVTAVAGIGDTLICGRDVDAWGMSAGSNQLMGGFWSDISKKSNNSRRTALDQARMQLLQQLLAAELNASAFGSVPSGGSGMFAQWEAALCGTSQNAINTAKQQAASFNSFGDTSTFTPGTSADSRTGRFVADIVFWDIIRP